MDSYQGKFSVCTETASLDSCTLIDEPGMPSYSSGCQTNLIVKHSNTVYVGETQKNGLRNETVLRLY